MLNAVRKPSRGFIEYNTYIIWKHWEKNFGPTFQVQLLAPWLQSHHARMVCSAGKLNFKHLEVSDPLDTFDSKILINKQLFNKRVLLNCTA